MGTTGERPVRLRPLESSPKCPPSAPDDERVEQLLRLYPGRDARPWVQQLVAWQRRADSWERYARRLEPVPVRHVSEEP
jgi:hypothetical protein